MAEHGLHTQSHSSCELLRALNGSLERLIEEILYACRQVANEAEWVADYVKTQHQNVELKLDVFRQELFERIIKMKFCRMNFNRNHLMTITNILNQYQSFELAT